MLGWEMSPEQLGAGRPTPETATAAALTGGSVEIFFNEYFHPGLLPDILAGKKISHRDTEIGEQGNGLPAR